MVNDSNHSHHHNTAAAGVVDTHTTNTSGQEEALHFSPGSADSPGHIELSFKETSVCVCGH